MTSDPYDRFVTLPGLTLPVAVMQLALDLEARGFRFLLQDNELLISPCGRLTDVDREQLRRWKPHLCALVTHTMNARPA